MAGTRQGTHAYSLSRPGGTWQAAPVWKNTDIAMYTASPVFANGVLYGFSNKRRGHFVALDAATGTVKWATQGRDGNHASILQTNDHLLLLNDSAALVVARRSPDGFKEERRIELGIGATWTLPVFLPDGLLVREAKSVVRLYWSGT